MNPFMQFMGLSLLVHAFVLLLGKKGCERVKRVTLRFGLHRVISATHLSIMVIAAISFMVAFMASFIFVVSVMDEHSVIWPAIALFRFTTTMIVTFDWGTWLVSGEAMQVVLPALLAGLATCLQKNVCGHHDADRPLHLAKNIIPTLSDGGHEYQPS